MVDLIMFQVYNKVISYTCTHILHLRLFSIICCCKIGKWFKCILNLCLLG